MPVTRVGIQAVAGSPGQIVDIDPARISASITNASTVAVEYSVNGGGAWTSLAAGARASASCNTSDLRLRRTGSGAYPAPVDIEWIAQSEGEVNSLTALQASSVSGAGVSVSSSRAITAEDNGQFLKPTGAMTLTIPAGLSPMPSFTVDCPASGAVSIAASGGATINGATTTLTRTRAANPVGFVVLAHESDAFGVSGA